MSEKTALSNEERMRVAVAHYCDGVPQHVIAALLGINSGRVAEACKAVRLAVDDPVATIRKLDAPSS